MAGIVMKQNCSMLPHVSAGVPNRSKGSFVKIFGKSNTSDNRRFEIKGNPVFNGH